MSESTPVTGATGSVDHSHSGSVTHEGPVIHAGVVKNEHIAPKPDYGLFNRIALGLTMSAVIAGVGLSVVARERDGNNLKQEAIAAVTKGNNTFIHLGFFGKPTTYAVDVDHTRPPVDGKCVAIARSMEANIDDTTGLSAGVSIAPKSYPGMPKQPQGVAQDSPAMKAYDSAMNLWDYKKNVINNGHVAVVAPCKKGVRTKVPPGLSLHLTIVPPPVYYTGEQLSTILNRYKLPDIADKFDWGQKSDLGGPTKTKDIKGVTGAIEPSRYDPYRAAITPQP